MQIILLAVVAVAGLLNTVQSGANATLEKSLGVPVWTAAAVGTATFLTTWTVALAFTAATGQRPSMEAFAAAPWWAWIGGALGAVYVLATVLVAQKVGAGVFIGVTVTVAVITSLTMDHFGLLGFEVHKAGVARLSGAALMIGGLAMIARF